MDAANKAILERAKKTRSVSRSLVTKQINKLESEISNSADKTTVHEICMQLISKFEELSTLDKEIESLIDIESLEDEIVTREEYRDKFIIWKICAERYVGSVSNIAIQNSVENQPQYRTLPLNSTVSSVLTNQPRLPKITLESFSGKDISSFPNFWARFKSAVHKNSSLNDVDKFSYLKSVVTSDAELAIRGLTSENYAKAIKILEDRFGRKEFIVDFHMNRLLNLTPVRSDLYWYVIHWIKRLDSSLVAVETSLEWSLQGKCDERSDCTSVHLVHSEEESISAELRRFWEIKSLGILDKDSVTLGNGDEEIFDLVHTFSQKLLKHHFKKYKEQYPHTFEFLNSSIYVDDLICGRNNVPDALRTTLECLQIFNDAVMLLRKCRSNSIQLNLLWQQDDVEMEFSETSAIDLRPLIKVLRLAWDPEKDLIYFDPKDLLKFLSRRGESKRFILDVVGRIFDPIGILVPFVIKLKCLLQDLWTLGVHWDSELPPKLRHKWQQWSSEAEGLTEIKIPRFYLSDMDQEISKFEIHCFSDASKSAYETILYLRFVICNNEIETSFICSKSRVAPLN
ncbi:DUF1758 domain-containing protein [Trichonephila clavipes]|nr:DUF1758 domain-containing protein [Trichonephila clavipes]